MKVLCSALALATILALAVAPSASATFPGRNGLIAYTGTVGNGSDIFTVDPESGTITRLTTAPGDDSAPSWSPDGRRIAFESHRDGSDYEIYVMNADGSDQKRLTRNPAQDVQPAWSPDGRIVFSSNRLGNSHLFVMNADGTHVRQLTFGTNLEWSPDWSPDGSTIVFNSDRFSISDIWVMNVADGSMRLLAGEPDGSFEPKWSPDGTKISYSAGESFNPAGRLSWMAVDQSAGGYLTGEHGAFSPDGTTYTYTIGNGIYVNGSAEQLAVGSEPDWGVRAPPVRCEVPRLRGRTLVASRPLLLRHHCRLGRVSRKYSRRVGRGRIVAQSPHAGALRPANARVAVVVSRGIHSPR